MPQKKVVHIYRLIADKTSDVFLNNISFNKAAMHEAFVGSSKSISMYLSSRIFLHHPEFMYPSQKKLSAKNLNLMKCPPVKNWMRRP
jgi:hypothetical protein